MTVARNEITIKLLKYHASQQKVVDNATRFNTLNCGRRWGKNELAKDLLVMPAIEKSLPVAWFEPTYKSLSEVWKEVKDIVAPITKHKSEQLKQIQLITGGLIDFWSLEDENAGRGRKYKRIIVNEVAMAKKFDNAWEQAIRPTLTDYLGDAWLLSTPKGLANFWYDFCQKNTHGWQNFTFTSYDNPVLDSSEVDAAKAELHPLVFAQEYMAQFVDLNEIMFFYAFDDEKHTTAGQLEIDLYEPLWFSLDFNVTPATCLLSQKLDRRGLFFYKCIQQNGGTRALCQRLKAYANHPGGIRITGDCSGFSSSSAAGHVNDFEIVKDELNVSDYNLSFNRRANASHAFSRELCNSAFTRLPITIQTDECQELIYDLRTGQPTKTGALLKNRDHHKQDAGDAFRYQINAWFANYSEIDAMSKNLEWINQ